MCRWSSIFGRLGMFRAWALTIWEKKRRAVMNLDRMAKDIAAVIFIWDICPDDQEKSGIT